MESFQIFIESSELSQLFGGIISNRFDRTPRLVAADWLDEHNSPAIAALLRMGSRMYDSHKEWDQKEVDEFNKLDAAAIKELEKLGIILNIRSTSESNVFFNSKIYRLLHGVQVYNRTTNSWQPVKKDLPEEVAKAFLVIIAGIMSKTRSDTSVGANESVVACENVLREIRLAYAPVARSDPRAQIPLAQLKRMNLAFKELLKLAPHLDKKQADKCLSHINPMIDDLKHRYLYRNMKNSRQPWADLLNTVGEAESELGAIE